MPIRAFVLCGPAHSGKTEQLLARYRTALAQQPPGTLLWLTPTWRAAAEIRLRLFEGRFVGCFAPQVMTFEKFAEDVLHEAGAPLRSLSRLMKRELVRQIIGEQSAQGRLKHFQSIVATGGLVDQLCEFISELKRSEIWPDDFHRACAVRGVSDKDVELLEIYDAYQRALREHGLFDAEGRFWSARDELARGEGRETRGEGNAESESSLHPSSFILHSLRLVVIDGFADFTRTQHEIIELLAKRAAETIVTLPLEPEPRRGDLFAKSLKTLDELRRRHGDALSVQQLPASPRPEWPAMARLERTLFANPRGREGSRESRVEGREVGREAGDEGSVVDSRATSSPLNIEILAAARQVGEIELIGARIKRLLVDGLARPGQIAIVFRSPQAVGELVVEVFGRLGIPVMFESGQSLDRSPALRALAALLQLDLDDWPFDQLLSVVGSNYLWPDEPGGPNKRQAADVELSIRQLQVPHGRQRLIEQLSSAEDNSRHRAAARKTTATLLHRLAAALDALPQRATLPQWAAAWRQLANETGLLRAMEIENRDEGSEVESSTTPSPLLSLSDRRAWKCLMEVLAAGDKLAGWLDRSPPELDRRAAFDALLDILRSERVADGDDESGFVRVLSAASVRSLRIPYLFLAGLSEKAFPPPDRDDRLYGEADYVRLIEAGLPLVARAERTQDEMLLFYEVITRATKRLYLSYPALDESAQPLLPSPFLDEVEQAFGPGRIPRTERTDLRPIPPDDQPLSEAEFRVKAVATALEGNVALLAGLLARGERRGARGQGPGEGGRGKEQKDTVGAAVELPDQLGPPASRPWSLAPDPSPLVFGLQMIYLRQDRHGFGPAEGVLEGAAAHAYLSARFPQTHVFAATEIERYASCPFQFFLERVLKVEPVDDLALEFDVLQRGRLVHGVLAAFHRRVNERLGRPASPLMLEAAEFDALLAAAIAESLPPEPSNSLQAALGEVDRRLIVEWLSSYREQLQKYDDLWQDFESPMSPELFEASFGRGNEPPPSVDAPLEFIRDGQVVRISGRIDRVDTGTVARATVCNVLDYKTGRSISLTTESIQAGLTLQLPLYALAATELLLNDRNACPWQAGYWYLREGGFKPRQALRMYRRDDDRLELENNWEDIRDGLGDTVVRLVRAIRRGQFPVCSADEHCTGHCPYRTICRINQVRSLEKTWQPTAAE
jgi:ATP-dependent helicase/nuclease subunit B